MSLTGLASGLIALGHPLVLVRYIGDRRGSSRIRGQSTQWEYRFDASRPDFWVADPDLSRFRARLDFEVHDEARTNEPVDRVALVEAKLQAVLETINAAQWPRRSTRRGRPRTFTDDELIEMNHLNVHRIEPWTYADLAEEFYLAVGKRPADAMGHQIRRFRKRASHLTSEDGCPRCSDGDLGRPPPRRNPPRN